MLRTAEEERKNSCALLCTPTHGHVSIGRTVKTYIDQPCVDTLRAVANRDRWWERVKGIYTVDDNEIVLSLNQD